LLEGGRRVGKSTIAEEFAKNEYASYILIDFANVSSSVLSCFDDIHDLDLFFLRLQAITEVNLIIGNSVIIFDEIQLFPKARQAIKYLVKDGRYHYIETGSLISIKKNVKDILIPSEEMKLQVYPMDFEEFSWATKNNSIEIIKKFYDSGKVLYYHTWKKKNSTHYYEIDFLLSNGIKVSAIEVKSAGVAKHNSLDAFSEKYSSQLEKAILLSQKDKTFTNGIYYYPIYMGILF